MRQANRVHPTADRGPDPENTLPPGQPKVSSLAGGLRVCDSELAASHQICDDTVGRSPDAGVISHTVTARLNWEKANRLENALTGPPLATQKRGKRKRRHRRKPTNEPATCYGCGMERPPGTRFWRGYCGDCRETMGSARRAKTGANVIAKGKIVGTETRDGQEYTVVKLPPKKRGGWIPARKRR